MSNHNEITKKDAKTFAQNQAMDLRRHLQSQNAPITTDEYRIGYVTSLVIDILEDELVIDEIHWQLKRNKLSVLDDLGEQLIRHLSYTYNTTEPYLNLYRKSMQ